VTFYRLGRVTSLISSGAVLSKRCPKSTPTLRFLRAFFQLGKRAAGEPTKFNRSGIELLGVVSAAGLECRKPVAEAGELIRRQLGDGFGDVFDFHAGQYSTAGGLVEPWKGI
jgi:hypothetical protein